MLTTNKSGVAELVRACVKNGMRKVVCSPGSRNAPLVIAFDEHPEIETFVIHDERSAAFYALGLSEATGEPVGVTCTSGSAMLNYYPAVAEAYYRCIPLIVLSADRPEEWVNHGDGQTIVQKQVYTNHIREELVIPEFRKDGDDLENQIKQAFDKALSGWKGPIHFNIPISEPLYDRIEIDDAKDEPILRKESALSLSGDAVAALKEEWKKYPKKMIICGQLEKDAYLSERLVQLSDNPEIAVLVENTSNMIHRGWVHCIDRTLAGISEDEIVDFQPDLLITLGGAVISKRIKAFLRNADVQAHWKVGFEFPEMDTYRALTRSFEAKPSDFLNLLVNADLDRNQSNFGAKWKQRDYLVKDEVESFLTEMPYGDLSVFQTLLDFLPENSRLHMSNSSAVRYCQLFDPVKSVHYHSNRGTSGIDGSTSTACGIALATPDQCNVLITGDISFFYDSNALWSNHLPANLRIFLINNGGGGIFRIIDGPKSTSQLERYFEARHDTRAEHICKAHGVEYSLATSINGIESQLQEFYKDDSHAPKLMEIVTPREVNDKMLKQFFQSARQ